MYLVTLYNLRLPTIISLVDEVRPLKQFFLHHLDETYYNFLSLRFKDFTRRRQLGL